MAIQVTASEPRKPSSPAHPMLWRSVVTVVLVAAAAWMLWRELPGNRPDPNPVHYGFLAAFLLYVLSVWITGRLSPLQTAMGADGRLSTSKFQFLIWTAVVVFSYAWLYAGRAQNNRLEVINTIPQNVLLAMGISIVTMAGAKAITSSYILSGRINKPAPSEGASAADLVANDNEAPDLTKIQMLVWTFVAAATYLVHVAGLAPAFYTCKPVETGGCAFPDIDAALMVLMGLGQGAYLGNKLVTVDTPRITGSTPAGGAWGTKVKLTGAAFGATPQWVTVNGVQVPVDPTAWKDNEIVVAIPHKRPSDSGDWRFNEMLYLGVMVNGRQGVGTAAFQILPPSIQSATPVKDAAGTRVTLAGSAFGAGEEGTRILLNDVAHPLRVSKWEDEQIVFMLPSGAGWETGKQVRVRIEVGGQPGPTEKQFVIP
jgi:hypothetical protein